VAAIQEYEMQWIIVIALYALGMGLFHILGGLGAAAEHLRSWGESHTTLRDSSASVSS
jgi:hypothetical protein